MGMPIITHGVVASKSSNDGTNRYGEKVTYYNIELGKKGTFTSQLIGVPKEVYDAVEVGQDIQLGGEFGGLKNKYWKFDTLIKK